MTDDIRRAWGFGLATIVTSGASEGTVLDTWFPTPSLGARPAGAAAPGGLAELTGEHPLRRVRTEVIDLQIELDAAPSGGSDAYLRLHLLSHRLVEPHEVNVDGIFGQLANVTWTNHGPCPVDEFEQTRLRLRGAGPVNVLGVDKFPRMVDYVVPSGVRIADADRVRLGAH